MFLQLVICMTLTFVSSTPSYFDELRMRNSVHLRGRVGSHVTFMFNLEFPNDYSIPYQLSWMKDVSNFR